MRLFFINPITLLLFRAINPDLNIKLQAFFVDKSEGSRLNNIKSDYSELAIRYQLEIALIIGKELNISVHSSGRELILEENDFSDWFLPGTTNFINLIFQSSDLYCTFGFDNYFRHTRRKIKLWRSWNRARMLNLGNRLYLYHATNSPINRSDIEYINMDSANNFLNLANRSVLPKIIREADLNREHPCLLVMPPRVYDSSKFFDNFFSYCIKLARKEGLKIFIKPHRNDLTDYKTKFRDQIFLQSFNSNIKYTPSEFLLNMDFVKKIIAVPSSSLAFANPAKTTIICPRNSYLFGRKYLDQTVFLRHLGLDYITI